MPHMGNYIRSCKKEVKLPAVIILTLIIFGSSCIMSREEGFQLAVIEVEPLEKDIYNDEISIDHAITYHEGQIPLTNRVTRAGPEDLTLQYLLGYGSMIGFLNSIKSADLDNDGKEEMVFGNEEGNVYVMERDGDDLIREWVSPNLGGNTYGLALNDVDSDGFIEIVIGSADGIVRIYGFNDMTYELEWESPDLGNYAYGLDIGNVDNDANLEIVVGTGEIRFDYDTDGGWSAGTSFSPLDENLFIFQYNGATFEQEWSTIIPALYDGTGIYNIAIGDTDGDSINEIVVGTFEWELLSGEFQGRYGIYGFDGSSYYPEWTIRELGNWIMGMGVDDTDNDGDLEIAIAVWEDAIYVYGYEFDPITMEAVYFPEWQSPALSPFTIAVGDTDGDNITEIVESEGNIVNLYDFNGITYIQTWTSGELDEHVTGLGVGQTDGILPDEILIGDDFSILIYKREGNDYLEDVYEAGFGGIVSICTSDLDKNGIQELYILSQKGDVTILEHTNGDFHIKNTIDLQEGNAYTNIFTGDFDGDSELEIAVVEGNTTIKYSGGWLIRSSYSSSTLFFIEYLGGSYSEVARVKMDNLCTFSADVADFDDDMKTEVVIGGTNGDLVVIGYDATQPQIIGQYHVSNNWINCIGVGDTDDDGKMEIGWGNDTGTVGITEFDKGTFTNEWATTSSFPLALEIGTIDGDKEEEIFVKNGFTFPLSIFNWNGASYSEEATLTDYDMTFEEALIIGDNLPGIGSGLVINSFSSNVIQYITGYSEVWASETTGNPAQSAKISNIDDHSGKELIVAYDGSIFIYGKEYCPEAVLFVSDSVAEVYDIIEFDGSRSSGQGNLEYYFDFGDGNDTGWIPTPFTMHYYSTPNTYTASLKVRDSTGMESEISSVAIIILEYNEEPIAIIDIISPNPALEGQNVTLEGHGIDDKGIIAYNWTSSIDGYLGSTAVIETNELSLGTHIISFKVQDTDSIWSDGVTQNLRIHSRPTAFIDSITPNPAKFGEEVFFVGNASDDGSIDLYEWTSSKDGFLSDELSFSSLFLSLGDHNITFRVKDDDGEWSDDAISYLRINQAPTAHIDSISPSSANQGESVTFKGHGEDDVGITGYDWQSSIDGFLSNLDSFTIETLSIGHHVISFTVTDTDGAVSEEATRSLFINQIPTAYIDSISPDTAILGELVSFEGHGEDDGSISSYDWESSLNGFLSSKKSFSTSVLTVGTHEITLKVRDNKGTWSEGVTETLTVIEAPENVIPVAVIDSVSPQELDEGEEVTFIGHGNDEDGEVTEYLWESDMDGFLSDDRSFSFSDLSSGTHVITFRVKDDRGDWSESTQLVVVVKEKEEDEEGGFDFSRITEDPSLLLFMIIVVLVVIVALVALISRRKKRREQRHY